MGLIGYNKRFLATTVNTPSSTHDPRLLKHTEVFQGISNDNILPNKSIKLGVKFGETLLVTVFAYCIQCISKISLAGERF